MTTDFHEITVSSATGNVIVTSPREWDRDKEYEEVVWSKIPVGMRTLTGLYGLSEHNMLYVGAEILRDALERDPEGTMRALGVRVTIPTLATLGSPTSIYAGHK